MELVLSFIKNVREDMDKFRNESLPELSEKTAEEFKSLRNDLHRLELRIVEMQIIEEIKKDVKENRERLNLWKGIFIGIQGFILLALTVISFILTHFKG